MKNRLRVLSVFGTRPEAIKFAPIVEELEGRSESFESVVAVTAQHREMLDQVLGLFGIVPQFDLDIMLPRQGLADTAVAAIRGMSPLLEQLRPDAMLVQGDTTTTLGAALVGFYHRVPVGHVEAGLRTNDLARPFPEEGNRQMVSRISHWHFAPTAAARQNLLMEGIAPEAAHVTGNPVVDALLQTRDMPYEFDEGPVREVLRSGRRIILVTAHRRENWGEPFRRICHAIIELVRRFPDIHVLFVTHLNPVVASAAHEMLAAVERVELIGPLQYLPFVKLMDATTLILSDSGGIQEEAPTLGVPTLVLRDVTERPEALEAGVVSLVGTDTERILGEASGLLTDSDLYNRMSTASNPFGDGEAARRIVDLLARDMRDTHIGPLRT